MNANLMLRQTICDRYYIIRLLGGGEFGTTFIAEDRNLPGNPQCVVKQFTPRSNDPSTLRIARRLFDEEAKVLQKLGNHKQIPRLLAYSEENQEFFLVQELIEGDDLSKEITLGKQLSESYVIDFLRQVLQALKFVHEQGVIHRDLKPSNLIRRASDDKIVLIDFGAVKQISTQVANAQGQITLTVVVGTPGYMPIEQINGLPGFYSDVYAVGMIGIQALTGISPMHLPKNSDGQVIWRDKLRRGTNYTPELLNILDTMVRSNFKKRYQSAAEALDALNRIPTQRGILWKILSILGVAVVSSLIVLLLVSLFQKENFLTYENNTYGIKIDYPESWNRQDINDIYSKGAIFLSPFESDDDTFQEQVSQKC